jgi:hypothetical protein
VARKSYIAENRELAYRIWRECGQNIELALRKLRQHPQGFPLSKPTLYDWMETYNWKDRAAKAETEEQRATDAVVSAEGKAIAALESVQQNYEAYFKTLGASKVDNQAMFAYTGVVKAVMELKAKTSAYKASFFLEFMKDLVEWLAKNDPDGLAVSERNFDDLAAWARARHGK